MPTSVTMPALGESVTEGTVTRWLKQEGERVETDEPLLEVSTDKVDTEIPSPAAGVLSSIKVGEDETVEVGVELAVIDESGAGGGESEQASASAEQPAEPEQQDAPAETQSEAQPESQPEKAAEPEPEPEQQQPAAQAQEAPAEAPAAWQEPAPQQAAPQQPTPQQPAPQQAAPQQAEPQQPAVQQQPQQPTTTQVPAAQPPNQQPPNQQPPNQQPAAQAQQPSAPSGEDAGAYVTPLVRKLASEHDVDLSTLTGSGVGGRIRKQDVLEAAESAKSAAAEETPSAPAPVQAPAEAARLRGTTEKMSRPRKVIAQRMFESLQSTAQLTTVVEADVTAIARLRQRAKDDFQRREGVKLSFLPFFALAAVEALKAHPKVNAFIDVDAGEITYHDTENLGIAVDSERGLMVPVIHRAGDLNLGGLARKIADLAERTRANKVGPDELSGGTFTLTNTGSRGALFDTPILNTPQVGILGTGTVVKRPVVVDDPDLGEVISVRSMVYLALTYDHRLVDGADAARFLVTVKERLEAGAFESELGVN